MTTPLPERNIETRLVVRFAPESRKINCIAAKCRDVPKPDPVHCGKNSGLLDHLVGERKQLV